MSHSEAEEDVDRTPVDTLEDFRAKYGPGWAAPIEEFIRLSPSFPEELALARKIGVLIADLEAALKLPGRRATPYGAGTLSAGVRITLVLQIVREVTAMGLRIIEGVLGGDSNGRAVLYCSTSMTALPWIFETVEDAEAFVEKHGDIRSMDYSAQEKLVDAFKAELQERAEREEKARRQRQHVRGGVDPAGRKSHGH